MPKPTCFRFSDVAITPESRIRVAGKWGSLKIPGLHLRSLRIAAGRCRTTAAVAILVVVLGLTGGWKLGLAGGWTDAPPQGLPPAGEILPLSAANAIGKIDGAVSVGASGAAAWTTVLKTVPGVGGIEPSLSFTYDSGGYGGLGIGFSLNAGDAIARCRRTLGQDGRQQPMLWTQDAPLCLGNSRLVALSGMHGASGTKYRLQTNPNVQVKAIGNSVDAQSGFAVYTPDGRVTHYGAAPGKSWTQASVQSATINGVPVPFSWHVAFVLDRASHNQMQYHYAGKIGRAHV